MIEFVHITQSEIHYSLQYIEEKQDKSMTFIDWLNHMGGLGWHFLGGHQRGETYIFSRALKTEANLLISEGGK